MAFIFLDIDGVLNSDLFNSKRESGEVTPTTEISIDPFCMANLNYILECVPSHIVVTSSRRRLIGFEEFKQQLKDAGLSTEITDVTPFLETIDDTKWEVGRSHDAPRGLEIKVWMGRNVDLVGKPYDRFNNYIILDDDTEEEFLLDQFENFFKIDPYIGLTPSRANQIIRNFPVDKS